MSQEKKCYKFDTKVLDVGVYDYGKVKKSIIKELHGEEARKALAERIKGNQELISFIGGYLEEQDIIAYYPSEDIAIFECPARGAGVHDLKKLADGFGEPKTYVYSPSKRFRFSSFQADGLHFYLEEKVNGKYQLCECPITGTENSFYWEDDNTICYLKDNFRYVDDQKVEYWIGYRTKINTTTCKE